MKAARRKGGANRRRRPATPSDPAASMPLRTIEDCTRVLEAAGADLERLDFSAARVRLRILLASEAARLIESSDLTKRLEEVEAQLLDRRGKLRRLA